MLGCLMYLKCTCPTTKSRIDELTKCSFCFRQFIHSFTALGSRNQNLSRELRE